MSCCLTSLPCRLAGDCRQRCVADPLPGLQMAPKQKAHSAAQAASKKKTSAVEIAHHHEQRIREALRVGGRAGGRAGG